MRGRLVAAVAEAIKARGRTSKIDDDQEEAASVETGMRAEPRQAKRQCRTGVVSTVLASGRRTDPMRCNTQMRPRSR